MVEFELDGQKFLALNGGPQFKFTEAVSFQIMCDTQAEVDHYWNGLLSGGGKESRCGWLKDRFGLSWQVVPRVLGRLHADQGPGGKRAMGAMMGMAKLDIAGLERAHAGE
jgi:predicted 3-demethylubiquinone-9 3-methyltransferase (glyoxalase superfamily)